jgi:hypothetical protein
MPVRRSSSPPERQYRLPKAQLFRFLETLLRMRDRPDGSRKADFAEIDAIGGQGKTGQDDTSAAATARSAAGSLMR